MGPPHHRTRLSPRERKWPLACGSSASVAGRRARETPGIRCKMTLTVRVTRARALAWIAVLFSSPRAAGCQKEGDPPSRGVSLTPVPQAGVPIPPIRPLLYQPLNYFFSLPGLPTRRAEPRPPPSPHPLSPPAKMPESGNGILTRNSSRRHIPPPPSTLAARLTFIYPVYAQFCHLSTYRETANEILISLVRFPRKTYTN